MTFTPPIDDIRFALDVVGYEDVAAGPALADADIDTLDTLLREFGRFVAEVPAPLNRVGDEHGCRLDPATGAVTTPPGFPEAYRRFVEAGWPAVAVPSAIGGGGFPRLAGIAFEELLTAANMAFSLCPMLTHSAVELLARWGSPDQQARYLPKLVSGEWTGTMNLTEPDAGSDVGALRAVARRAEDGSWLVSGTKIFVTWGAHDVADNTVHLVLARAEGAPAGTKGISLFLVPERLLDADGGPGPRNAVQCVSIEHKLGIHASPTCVLAYEDAVGELVGELHGGLRAMFTMMNSARLSVAVEGLGVAERAYQKAARYACERVQGRLPGGPPEASVPIEAHPDVRRMLLTMRSHIEAMRLLLYWTARAVDTGPGDLVDLLIPVCKAWCTDLGSELSSIALQVHGGVGYVEEAGVAQHYRDARIASIYEGTNGIHGADLVMRKLGRHDGKAFRELLDDVEATVAELRATDDGELGPVADALHEATDPVRAAATWLQARTSTAPLDALAGATAFTRMTGTLVGGWLLARQALHARAGASGPEQFLAAKRATARFFAATALPTVRGLLPAATAGHGLLDAVAAEALLSR